uniref:Uncharacterized protein n=1 Tax=Cyanothece sp. (strain PCC 7425 / ATCC 29141) TaxID=395961 RepID=B8HX35_CYAP4
MPDYRYLSWLLFLFFALIGALWQISTALDEADLDGLLIWTSIATVIAALPSAL